MEPIEELTFSFATMVQLMGGVAFAVSAWFYLRSRFEQNATQLSQVTTTLSSLDKKLDTKFESLDEKFQKQNESIIKIEAHGTVLEERIRAMAGPRAT